MKNISIILCAAVLLTASTVLFAQKTEVSVRKGRVVAETPTASIDIEAGRKAVLTKDANPVVTVDSPLVHDALELYKLIEKEKKYGDLRIDSTCILVGRADKQEGHAALFFEVPNFRPEATNVLTLSNVAILGDFRVYDMNGNLCRVYTKLVDETTASYSIHFSEKIQPGEHFRLIGVTSLEKIPVLPGGNLATWKEGSVRYFRTALLSPYTLNYYRLILPESAILIDANREIVSTDVVDGAVAVTMRNYTGPYSDGWCMIALLYPDEDGATLADIPDKYLGLQSKHDKEMTETFTKEMQKIRAGERYTDQSTPLAALLTCLGSIIHKDIDLYTTVKYEEQSPDRVQGHVKQAGYWADKLNLLNTPQWPDNPGDGYVHPICLCRKGSKICEFIEPSVYEDGKWYDHSTKQKQPGKSENITPEEVTAAKAGGYLCDWKVAGPYIEKDKKGTELFNIPFGPELQDVDVPWRTITLESFDQHPAYINLDTAMYNFDQAVAYLRTEIISDIQKPARLEIYTDDGVKAWLNGKLIHENNVSRGIQDEPDVVNVTLKEGTNQLMLKVTDDIWSWGAIVRLQPI